MKCSILIPSWNNLPYLRCCIESIRKHSHFEHQILVHVNEGNDGTKVWLQQEEIQFTSSPENIGICRAMNGLYPLATCEYIMYMNDDMYCLPDWDLHLANEVAAIGHSNFMLSATMIEPRDTGNAAVIVQDMGDSLATFKEQELLATFQQKAHANWSGSSWPPNMVHRSMWDKIGGYNDYFSPGMSSDDDVAMRMWLAGCRLFKGVSASRVYHFQCKSTGRIEKNDGRKQFQTLYGITQNIFNRYYLHKGQPYTGELKGPGLAPGFWLKKGWRAIKK